MKKIFLLLFICTLSVASVDAQVLFQERFSGFALNNGNAHITTYTTWNAGGLPTDTFLYKGSSPLPFGKAEYANDAWMVSKLPLTGDTVAMVAGYLQNAVYTPDRWLLLPPLTISQASVFLSWESKVASPSSFEAYQVLLATNNTANPTAADFSTTLFSTNMDTNSAYNNFVRRSVSLSAYNGQTVRIAFRYKNGTFAGANYCLYLDDIVVANVGTGTDVAMKEISMPRYVPKGNNAVSFTITNNSTTPVTSVEAALQLNGGTPTPATITVAPALAYGQSVRLSFPGTTNLPVAGSAQLKVFLQKVNGAASPVPANDTAVKKQFVYDYQPVRRLLLENITGAWCSACPDVSHELYEVCRQMKDTAIMASLHDPSTTYGDPMSVGLTSPLMSLYGSGSYPQVMFGRRSYLDRFPEYDFSFYMTPQAPSPITVRNYVKEFVPVDVSITGRDYNVTTRQITFTVQAKFVSDDDGAYNLNAYLIEDSCWSSNYGWAQYNGGNNDASSPYYGQGNPIPNYKHKNVVIAAMEGAWGNTTVIPATQTAGTVYSKQYTFTLPQPTANVNRYNPDKIRIMAFVQGRGAGKSDKRIVNASKAALIKPVGVAELPSPVGAFSVHPNPAHEEAAVQVELKEAATITVELRNALGQVVVRLPQTVQQRGMRSYHLPLDVAPGLYFVVLSANGSVETQKLVVE